VREYISSVKILDKFETSGKIKETYERLGLGHEGYGPLKWGLSWFFIWRKE